MTSHNYPIGTHVRHKARLDNIDGIITAHSIADHSYVIDYQDGSVGYAIPETELTILHIPEKPAPTTADLIANTHVPRTQVPIEQCIELINAALDYRTKQRAQEAIWVNDYDLTDAEKDRIATDYVNAHDRLIDIIDALPEQD